MKYATIVLVFTALQFGSAAAVPAAGISTTTQITCADWAKARSANKASMEKTFFYGLVTGLSLGSGTEFWNYRSSTLSPDQVFYWLDRFCENKPLGSIYEGAIHLMNERTNGEYGRRVSAQPD